MFVIALVPLSRSCERILCVLLSAMCQLRLFIRPEIMFKIQFVYLQVNEIFELLSWHKGVGRIKYIGMSLSCQSAALR